MTDDYLAISNTGKNITITMTPGMKQRILGDCDRIGLRFVRSVKTVLFSAVAPSTGYKIFRRKNVWNMSMSSKRFRFWPVHDRIVFALSHVHMNAVGAMITLPKTSLEEEFINAGGANIRMVVGESAPARMDYRNMHMPKFVEDAPPKELRQFNVPDMVVAAIAGGAIGVLITLLLAAAGWVK